MAVYKVPQDVEADDKLIGPFSFRQFIYLIIVVAAGVIGWFLSQLFLPLFVLALPFIVFFGALALPLRKDQPMETYLAAIVSFYLKPRKRLWTPDGIQTLVEITAPKVVEVQRMKDLSQAEAEQRLSYLASIVDSRGWAVRGVQGEGPSGNGVMNNDVYYEAQQVPDILDAAAGVSASFDSRLDQADAKRHQEMLTRLQSGNFPEPQSVPPPQPVVPTPPVTDPYASLAAPVSVEPAADDPNVHLSLNPYPTMHQSVVAPIDPNAPKPAAPEDKSTSEKQVSPDIINLANNPDLSVETIAREANRIHEKEKLSEDEVVISLR